MGSAFERGAESDSSAPLVVRRPKYQAYLSTCVVSQGYPPSPSARAKRGSGGREAYSWKNMTMINGVLILSSRKEKYAQCLPDTVTLLFA